MQKVAAITQVSLLCLASFLAVGCGKAPFTGTLINADGSGPVPGATQAQILSLSPSTIAAGSAPFILTVTGKNFTPSTAVVWDGSSLQTTYLSSTTLQAQVPASFLGGIGYPGVVPSPVGTLSFGATFTITGAPLAGNKSFAVSKTAVQANDMVWSTAEARLYLATSAADPIRPNTISSFDPETAQFDGSVATGSNPSRLAVSSDGTYLYTSLNDIFTVRRYTLPGLQPDRDIPLAIGSATDYVADDLAVQPTSPHTVAVARESRNSNYQIGGDVVLFDDSTPRPQDAVFGNNNPASLTWNSNGQSLYGVDSSLVTFFNMSVDSSGLQLPQAKPSSTSSGKIHFDPTTGYIYTDAGNVLSPGSDIPAANFPVNALQGGFGIKSLMVPDSTLNIAYFLGRTIDGPGPGNYVIEAFDLTHFYLWAPPLSPTSQALPKASSAGGATVLSSSRPTPTTQVRQSVFTLSAARLLPLLLHKPAWHFA